MYLMTPYDEALQYILDNGIKKSDRTGVGCISVAGMQSRYPLDKGAFPIVTGRKVFPKAIFAELLWFLSGSTKNQDLIDLGAKFWGKWCDEDNEKYRSLMELYSYEPGDFGPIYGWQLRHFGADYIQVNALRQKQKASTDHELVAFLGNRLKAELAKGKDQLRFMIDTLKNDPFGSNGRRCLFSLWNPSDLPKMALPPCFVPETLVVTEHGSKRIDQISSGDSVLTAAGRYCEVIKSMKTFYDGDIIEIVNKYGVEIRMTPNHPILIKDKGYIKAGDIEKSDFLGIPRNKESNIPILSEPYANQFGDFVKSREMSEDDFFLIGYFLGEGWVDPEKDICYFGISDKSEDDILPRIRKRIGILANLKIGIDRKGYGVKSKSWSIFLQSLGHKDLEKTIPSWILNSPKSFLKTLIEGYILAVGETDGQGLVFASTPSLALAQGIQVICAKLGDVLSISHQKMQSSHDVDESDAYRLSFCGGDNAVVETDFIWIEIPDKPKIGKYTGHVYNISVDEDHTYLANNVANHNCHYTYQAIPDGDGGLTGILTQRSCDFPVGVPANIQFYAALTMMLAQQSGMFAREFIHNTNDSHIYLDQIDSVKKYLKSPKPDSPVLSINKAADIYSYCPEDFLVKGYNPSDKIDIPVAV